MSEHDYVERIVGFSYKALSMVILIPAPIGHVFGNKDKAKIGINKHKRQYAGDNAQYFFYLYHQNPP